MKNGSSLTFLAVDEPEPYCLDDGGSVVGELRGRWSMLEHDDGEVVPYFARLFCSLIA